MKFFRCSVCGKLAHTPTHPECQAPPDGHRDGETYEAQFDYHRLNKQQRRVWLAVIDNEWHTLAELSDLLGDPETSISARLRDFRKAKFGSHKVDAHRIVFGGGTWEYRLDLIGASSGE